MVTDVFLNHKRVNVCEHTIKMASQGGTFQKLSCDAIFSLSSDWERCPWPSKYFDLSLHVPFLLRSLQFLVIIFPYFVLFALPFHVVYSYNIVNQFRAIWYCEIFFFEISERCFIIWFASLCKNLFNLLEFFSKSFSMPCA